MKKKFFYSKKKNNIKINFFLRKEFIPKDKSFEKLDLICKKYPILKKLVCLPDLNFKIKNFIPSGIVVPTKKYFFPSLLGTGNDGMILLKLSIDKKISSNDINKLFRKIKSEISIFRRERPKISEKKLSAMLFWDLKNILNYFGFKKKNEYEKFEYFDNKFSKKEKLLRIIKKQNHKFNFPKFVPSQSILKRSSHCIGVLDGTSHFIDIYKIKNASQKLDSLDYYFLVLGPMCHLGPLGPMGP